MNPQDNVIKIVGLDGYETSVEGNVIQLRPKWIRYNDRPPEPYDYVLVAVDSKGTGEPKPVNIARWFNGEWEFLNGSMGAWMDISYEMDAEDITHWMELPDAPK